jgi:hypothetical protein
MQFMNRDDDANRALQAGLKMVHATPRETLPGGLLPKSWKREDGLCPESTVPTSWWRLYIGFVQNMEVIVLLLKFCFFTIVVLLVGLHLGCTIRRWVEVGADPTGGGRTGISARWWQHPRQRHIAPRQPLASSLSSVPSTAAMLLAPPSVPRSWA